MRFSFLRVINFYVSIAISLILLSRRSVTSTSTLLMLLRCVDCMSMLACGGITKLAIMFLGIFGSSSVGSRNVQIG